ncbi:uncharacterized protein LOC120128690 [Hibiscus syriacus]|uniref:uncharacterized protein LOC120128690 n=1 Tax=Hibiscus syriacus TaxID=106335 RepID=UPI001924CFFE|nr:uncharacterized protein LOC120128690 [Hibiscus syriacus]
MKRLFLKLKRLKVYLRNLNKDFFSDISARVKIKREEIEKQQILTLRGMEPIEKELDSQRELNSLEEAESMFLQQKAKSHWLKEGDKCSKFFYSVIATKNKRDTIRVLVDDQGKRFTDPEVKVYSVPLLKGLLHHLPSPDHFVGLTKDVSIEEIKEAIFDQGNDKAPGPDGYTPLFFKKSWTVIKEDVIEAINYIFQESFIYPGFNATIIALVPKIPNPCKVSDFRPIFYCYVIYKTITKIIVKRISHLMSMLISPNQTAFVKGRSIVDNTLLAQEIVKGYGRNNISPRCALKIDLQKAFDSIH